MIDAPANTEPSYDQRPAKPYERAPERTRREREEEKANAAWRAFLKAEGTPNRWNLIIAKNR